MADTEPASVSEGVTTDESGEGRWLSRALTVLTVVVVIASAMVTAYQSWQMRELISFSTVDAVLTTLVLVLVPPVTADRAARAARRSTRILLVLALMAIALAYASLVAQHMTEQASPSPWWAAVFLTYASAGGACLLYLRARP